MYAMKRMNNDIAVSPIVATLVLIVVAVIGAVAVGTIMGTFSSSASQQVNSNAADAETATGMNILIAGSTTEYPASVLLAQDYMSQNPGVHISVQQGGSTAGISAAGQGIVDIGGSSVAFTAADNQEYPNLQSYLIGGHAVVWIVNKNNPVLYTEDKTDLYNFVAQTTAGNLTYEGTDMLVNALVHRSDNSGTESEASSYIGYPNTGSMGLEGLEFENSPAALLTGSKAVDSNSGMIAEIEGNTAGNEIGFIDLGLVYNPAGVLQTTAANIRVLNLDSFTYTSGTDLRAAAVASVKNKINGVAASPTDYPQALCNPLLYITNSKQTPVIKKFIHYAQSPSGGADLQNAGDFANSELV